MALRSTCENLLAEANVERHPGFLCHGLVGNALVLLEAARSADIGTARECTAAALSVGAGLAVAVHAGDPLFGESAADADNPSLMLGYAGIGHFLLRSAGVASGLRSPLWLFGGHV